MNQIPLTNLASEATRSHRVNSTMITTESSENADAIIEGASEVPPSPICAMAEITVQDICQALFDDAIRVNIPALLRNYSKRSVNRISGTRDSEGKIVPPPYKTQRKGAADYLQIQAVEYSRSVATLNVRFAQPVDLVEESTGKIVSEVAGIPLNLSDFRNYAIIGSGELNLPSISIRVSKQSVFDHLVSMGVVSGDFYPEKEYTICLEDYPVTTSGRTFSVNTEDVRDIFHLQVVKSFLNAATRKGAVDYTPEQIQALADHCLSPSLYYNAPTVNPYVDRDAAISEGILDIIPEYTCNFGIRGIATISQLHSANAFMKRYYTVGGQKDVTVPMLYGAVGPAERKAQTTRFTVTPVDEFMALIFDSLLGINNDPVKYLSNEVVETIRSREFDANLISEALREVDICYDRIQNRLTPIVFYIGASGDIPELGPSEILTGEDFAKAYPDTKASKVEKEGLFIVINGGEVTINIAEGTREVIRKTV